MRKNVLYLLVLITGLVIGFFIRPLLYPIPTSIIEKPKEIIVEKVKDKVVRDTVIVEKAIPIINRADSTDFLTAIDSTLTDSISKLKSEETEDIFNLSDSFSDSENDEEIIIREELLAKKMVKLPPPKKDTTDVSEILELKSNAFSKEISVEFWQSPIDITGYELSRNRLKLFGFNPNEVFNLQISDNDEYLILNTESISIILKKTDRFVNLNLR